jgi:hypothetical protein
LRPHLRVDTAIGPAITDAWVPAAPVDGHGCGKKLDWG